MSSWGRGRGTFEPLPPRIYDLRSTFASQALAAGVSVFELGRIMGTSVRMIERHYGALLQGSGDAIRGKLDSYLESLAQERPEAAQSDWTLTSTNPELPGVLRGGRYWARTSDPSLSSW